MAAAPSPSSWSAASPCRVLSSSSAALSYASCSSSSSSSSSSVTPAGAGAGAGAAAAAAVPMVVPSYVAVGASPANLAAATTAVVIDTGRTTMGGVKETPFGPVIYSSKETHGNKEAFRGKILLMFAPEMRALAEEVAAMGEGRIILGNIEWKRFPDTFPNLLIENSRSLKWAHVAFITSLHSPFVIFEQMSMIYAIPRYLAKSMKVIIPYFPTATMERISKTGEIATAHTLAKLFSQVPHAARGPAQLTILDIHTLQNQFYFSDDVLIRLKSATHVLRQEIPRLPDAANIVIAFPDDGAYKRFVLQFPRWKHVVCNKIREGTSRVVKIKEGAAECVGKHVIIVDDLVQSGGTLLECARALKAAGAGEVSAFVVHAVFPDDAWRKFVRVEDGGLCTGGCDFKHFFVTNTHPITQLLTSKPPFKVLSVAPLVHAIITEDEDAMTGEPRSPLTSRL